MKMDGFCTIIAGLKGGTSLSGAKGVVPWTTTPFAPLRDVPPTPPSAFRPPP